MRGGWRTAGIVVVLAACGSKRATIDTSTCAFTLDPSQVLGQTVVCGDLVVRERHGDPESPFIRVPFVQFKASLPLHPPVIHLLGGPGQSWGDFQLSSYSLYVTRAAQRDLIFVEQRGAALGRPSLACMALESIEGCRDRLLESGIDLQAYNNAALADDLVAVKEALGLDPAVLHGTSYGSMWALAALGRHPNAWSAALLDSVAPPNVPLVPEAIAGYENGLASIVAACAADSECRGQYGDLGQRLDAIFARLEKTPAKVSGSARELDAHAFFHFLINLLSFAPQLAPLAIAETASALSHHAELSYSRELELLRERMSYASEGVSGGLYLSILCQQSPYVSDADLTLALERVRPAVRALAAKDIRELRDACALWPVTAPEASTLVPVESDVPILIMSGELDPRTPPAWVERALPGLSHAQWARFPRLGHSVLSSADPCPGKIAQAFYAAPRAPLSLDCAETVMPFSEPTEYSPLLFYGEPPFELVSIAPENGSLFVSVDAQIELEFSDALDPAGSQVRLLRPDGSEEPISIDVDGSRMIIRGSPAFSFGFTFSVVLDEVQSISGRALDTSDAITFTTRYAGDGELALSPGSAFDRLVYDPVDHRIFALDQENGALSLIDLASRSVVAERLLPEGPSDLCLAPDHSAAYLVYARSSQVTELDPATLETRRQIATLTPRELYDATHVHVYCRSGALLLVDSDTKPGLWRLSLGPSPVLEDLREHMSGIGALAISADGAALYLWTQTAWFSPSLSAIERRDPASPEWAVLDHQFYSLDLETWQTPIFLDSIGGHVFVGRLVLDAEALETVHHSFPEGDDLHAVDFARGRAASRRTIWSLADYSRVRGIPTYDRPGPVVFDKDGMLYVMRNDSSRLLILSP